MDRTVTLTTPLDKDRLATLRAGDMILLSGTVYAARDTACLLYTSPSPRDLG